MEQAHANEIIDRLWLGDYHASQDETFLRSKHIDAVFNCTKDLPFARLPNITQYRIPLDDNLEEEEIRNAGLWSSEIAYNIYKHHKAGDRILVHCMAGRQRSAASVAMFLILTQGFTTAQVIAFMREKRPVAFMPQPNFLRSIQIFEERYQREILPMITGHRLE
jgi:rhodanese-related sulfurtransferase